MARSDYRRSQFVRWRVPLSRFGSVARGQLMWLRNYQFFFLTFCLVTVGPAEGGRETAASLCRLSSPVPAPRHDQKKVW